MAEKQDSDLVCFDCIYLYSKHPDTAFLGTCVTRECPICKEWKALVPIINFGGWNDEDS